MNRLKKYINKSFLLFSGKYDVDVEDNMFFVNPNFYYLTKINIPNYAVLYNHKTKKYTHFYKFNDPIWTDDKSYFKNIKRNVKDIKDINEYVRNLNKIYTLSNINKFYSKLKVKYDTKTIDDICHIFRIIKNKDELESIKKSTKLTCSAIKFVMRHIKYLNNENDVMLLFKKYLLDNNIQNLSFKPICASGRNNSILHYTTNNKKISRNSLILMDVGCKYNNYCSDITRTFPRSGKFTEKQKDIYNIVYECNKEAIKQVKNNANWKNIEKNIRLLMFNMLLELDLVLDTNSINEKIKITKLFMPHGLGHSIGLETHEPEAKNIMDILKKNMVITIEPGVYFIDDLIKKSKKINQKKIKMYRSIGGVRIEDVVVVNQNNSSVLSNISKKIKDIEKLLH